MNCFFDQWSIFFYEMLVRWALASMNCFFDEFCSNLIDQPTPSSPSFSSFTMETQKMELNAEEAILLSSPLPSNIVGKITSSNTDGLIMLCPLGSQGSSRGLELDYRPEWHVLELSSGVLLARPQKGVLCQMRQDLLWPKLSGPLHFRIWKKFY